jgi:hypothetical protein
MAIRPKVSSKENCFQFPLSVSYGHFLRRVRNSDFSILFPVSKSSEIQPLWTTQRNESLKCSSTGYRSYIRWNAKARRVFLLCDKAVRRDSPRHPWSDHRYDVLTGLPYCEEMLFEKKNIVFTAGTYKMYIAIMYAFVVRSMFYFWNIISLTLSSGWAMLSTGGPLRHHINGNSKDVMGSPV